MALISSFFMSNYVMQVNVVENCAKNQPKSMENQWPEQS